MDVDLFVEQAVTGLKSQTEAHAATWHFGEEEDWAADLDSGQIEFVFADGTVATADLQVIGTYNIDDGTFLWAWDHPSVEEPLNEHAKLAEEFGHKHKLQAYTERKVVCSEDDAWVFTAVAARLGGANGAYRGTSGTTLIYMTFGEISLQKP